MSNLNPQIKEAIDSFDLPRARQLLRDALKEADAETFYLASRAALDDEQKHEFLQKALALDPFHEAARKAAQSLTASSGAAASSGNNRAAEQSKGTVIIAGSQQTFVNDPKIKIIVDGEEAALAAIDSNREFQVAPGQHTIVAKYAFRASRLHNFTIQAGERVVFQLSFDRLWGKLKLDKMS